jgi:hypothetical protein
VKLAVELAGSRRESQAVPAAPAAIDTRRQRRWRAESAQSCVQ